MSIFSKEDKTRSKFSSFDMLKPKNMILKAIQDKLADTGVVNLLLTFSVNDDNYSIAVSGRDNKSMNIEVTKDELTTIKKIFIKRIVNAWRLKYDIEPCAVIVRVEIENSLLELFIQDDKKDVYKFDY